MRLRLTQAAATAWMARFGYGARGVVYLIVGAYAALAAFGADEPESTRGALARLFTGPLGPASLLVITAGLVAYSLWRLLQSLLDADDHGRRAGALMVRTGLLFSGLLHFSLALFAATLAFSAFGLSFGDGEQNTNSTDNWAAWPLAQPYGRLWVLSLGVALAGTGAAIGWKGASAGFAKWFDMANPVVKLLSPVCQFGLVARGFVLTLIGLFLVAAAVNADAGAARGLADAMLWLQAREPFGQWLFALLAAGLIAFGIYGLMAAAFREVQGLDRYTD